MVRTYALVSLRLTLLAAIGVSSTACGGKEVGGNPAGGSAGTSGTGGTAGSGGSNRHCPNAVPIMQPSGKPSGFVLCEDGTKNRVSKEICDTVTSLEACRGDEQSTVNCLTDSDCTDKPYGKCVSLSAEGFESDYCGCVYACSTDSDCKGNDVCVCAGVAGASHCAGSSCTINDDCVSNECSVSVYDNGCNETTTLHCRAADDACRTDADCTEPNRNQCAVDDGSQDFSCLGTSCAIGRPLMVDGSVRATRSKSRDDWRDRNMTPDLTTMQPEVMEALANRWADIAAMEHASVASFARFTLQLMALGAPADLLGETQ
ncbi:MAG: Tenascin, partial [Sorangium cellulosum]